MRNVVATQELHYNAITRELVGLNELVVWYEVDVFIQAISEEAHCFALMHSHGCMTRLYTNVAEVIQIY